jgi:Flp pilus assembly protein TadD
VLAALPLVLVTTGLMLSLGLRPLMADVVFRDSLDSNLAFPERVEAGERAVSWWPLEPEYHRGLANLLATRGDYGPAVAQLAAAQRLSPNDPQLWAAMGHVYARWAGEEPAQSRRAQAAYEQALALAPNTASNHTALGAVLVRRGQLELGAAQTERAVQLDATDVMAYRQLAAVYQALGRAADARWADDQASYWLRRTSRTAD